MPKRILKPAWGRINYSLDIEDLLNFYRDKINDLMSNEDYFFSLGLIEGIDKASSLSHKGAIDLLISTKRDIQDLETDDPELYLFEIEYEQGMIEGILKVLEINRSYFEKKPKLSILGLFSDEETLEKYTQVMDIYEFTNFTEDKNVDCYFFTCNIEELAAKHEIFQKQNIEFSVILVSSEQNKVMINSIKPLMIDTIRLFVIHDKEELNAQKIINKVLECSDLNQYS